MREFLDRKRQVRNGEAETTLGPHNHASKLFIYSGSHV
jgi:hypothetical protein